MYRMRKRVPDTIRQREPWRGCEWDVSFTLDSRRAITRITVFCHKTLGPDVTVVGMVVEDVGPFDDLWVVIDAALTDSALDALDHVVGEQMTLPVDPPPAA